MGSAERTDNDIQADAFFAQFENATPDLVARISAERDGNLHAVTAEDKAYGYWSRKIVARDTRRADRAAEAARAQQAQLDRLDTLRTTPAPAGTGQMSRESSMVLPVPRIASLTDAERVETARWWQRIEDRRGTRTLIWRMRTEVATARATARSLARATKAWQAEQRAFERAQWQAVTKSGRARRKVDARWVAISEDRALRIALAALEHRTPPQAKN